MAKEILPHPSHTFNEFLLLPGLTRKDHRPEHISLRTPLAKFKPAGEESKVYLNTPTVSAIMQAVSGPKLAASLAQEGGLSFLPASVPIEHISEMYRETQSIPFVDESLALSGKDGKPLVGIGLNTRDYMERVETLVAQGAFIFCFDSSDGFTEWQCQAAKDLRSKYGDEIIIGGGNVVYEDGFRYLVEEAGLDFVKIGIGGGSICITREQKGIGLGQGTAVYEVAKARDKYLEETGIYIPICSDGGIVYDYHITIALALGSDFVMMGRYFARFDESPPPRRIVGDRAVKEYWGEGTKRAQNWQRYHLGEKAHKLVFEEGVEGFVQNVGPLRDNLQIAVSKIKSTMSNVGCDSIEELHQNARLAIVSTSTLTENGAHDLLTMRLS